MTTTRKILLSAAGPHMKPVLDKFALPLFKKYAKAQSYSLNIVDLPADSPARKTREAMEARWKKIKLLRSALQDNDIAVWFDADVLIRRFDEDISIHLAPEAFQGLALEKVPAQNRVNPNTGVWVMRNSSLAGQFLDELERIGPPGGRWADQGAVLRALGWELGDKNYHGAKMPSVKNKYLSHTSWLPISWNQVYMGNRPNPEAYVGRPRVKNPHAIHFTNMTAEERLKQMPIALQ